MASAARYSLNKNKYLLTPEVDKLHQILNGYMHKNTRDCLLISLAIKSGARAQELLNLRFEDLNHYDETIFIRGIKGSNDREIPLPSKLFKTLALWSQDKSQIFDISYHRLWQIWEFYRPVQKKFHSLRHTFAIELYQKTKDLRLVQVALGHRNIMNTMIYADYVYSTQELKKLIL